MPTFVLYYPEKDKRWKVEVKGQRFLIGRTRDAEVCIPHVSVSKQHVLVERRGPRYVYRDLGSKNGILLNGFRVDQGALDDGDELRVGSILVTFYREGPPRAAAAPSGGAEPKAARAPLAGQDPKAAPGPAAPPLPPAPAAAAPSPRAEETPSSLSLTDLERELGAGGVNFEGGSTIRVPVEELNGLVAEPLRPGGESDPDLLPRTAPRVRGKDRAGPKGAPIVQGPRELPRSAIVLGGIACVALGLLLGYVGGRMDAGRKMTAASREPSLGSAKERGGSAGAPREGEEAGAAGAGAPALPLGPPAALDDPETARRLSVRLFLDIVGRPPLCGELNEIAVLPAERLWEAVHSKAPPAPPPPPERLAEVFERFMGRKPEAHEDERLRELSGDDPDHYAFCVGTSRDYASAAHRRKRSPEQLAWSLLVDLTGDLPAREHVKKTLDAVGLAGETLAPVAKAITDAASPRQAGPRAGESPEEWIRGAYERLLLRSPSAEELRLAADRLKKEGEGWRSVLLELASRVEYLSY